MWAIQMLAKYLIVGELELKRTIIIIQLVENDQMNETLLKHVFINTPNWLNFRLRIKLINSIIRIFNKSSSNLSQSLHHVF